MRVTKRGADNLSNVQLIIASRERSFLWLILKHRQEFLKMWKCCRISTGGFQPTGYSYYTNSVKKKHGVISNDCTSIMNKNPFKSKWNSHKLFLYFLSFFLLPSSVPVAVPVKFNWTAIVLLSFSSHPPHTTHPPGNFTSSSPRKLKFGMQANFTNIRWSKVFQTG